jgi:hypothetical protein
MNRRITLNAIARGDVPCCVVPDRSAAYALTGRQGRPAPTPITRPALLSPWHPSLNAMPGSNRRFICSLAEIPPGCGDLGGSGIEKANPAPRAMFDQSPARNARMLTPFVVLLAYLWWKSLLTVDPARGVPIAQTLPIYHSLVEIRVFDSYLQQRITTEERRHREEYQVDHLAFLLCGFVALW